MSPRVRGANRRCKSTRQRRDRRHAIRRHAIAARAAVLGGLLVRALGPQRAQGLAQLLAAAAGGRGLRDAPLRRAALARGAHQALGRLRGVPRLGYGALCVWRDYFAPRPLLSVRTYLKLPAYCSMPPAPLILHHYVLHRTCYNVRVPYMYACACNKCPVSHRCHKLESLSATPTALHDTCYIHVV